MFDRLTEHMVNFQNIDDEDCKIFICEDLNARTGDLKNYVSDGDSRHIYALPKDYTVGKEMQRGWGKGGLKITGLTGMEGCY